MNGDGRARAGAEDGIPPRAGADRRQYLAALGAAVVSAVVLLGPALAPGYVLVGDMVFVPRLPMTEGLLGVSSQAPRAVPSDAVVAVLSTVVPGQVVQKLVLLAILVAAGTGAGVMVRLRPIGAAAASVAAVWNPYVAERLAVGQWAVLIGYAAVPWVLRLAWHWGATPDSGTGWPLRVPAWRRLAVAVALGSLGGAPAWVMVAMASLVGYLTGAGRRWRRLGGATLVVLLGACATPWAAPALLRPGGTVGDRQGVVFAPAADTPLGTVGSLLTGGGIWNHDAVPAGRDTLVGALAALVVLAVGVAGLVSGARPRTPPDPVSTPGDTAGVARAALLAGLFGLVLALLVVPRPVGEWLAGVPGAGLLRDGARQVGPWVVALALGIGLAADLVAAGERRLQRVGGLGLATAVAVLPAAALPAAAWGMWGRLQAVDYPGDYARVAALVRDRQGAVVVLPFESYRRFDWNLDRAALDPLPRWLRPVTLAGVDLVVRQADGSAVRVQGEDQFAVAVSRALRGNDPAAALGRLGVAWVVSDDSGADVPSRARLRYLGPHLRLYGLPEVNAAAARDPDLPWQPSRAAVLVADAVAAAVVAAALLLGAPGRRGRRRTVGQASSARDPG